MSEHFWAILTIWVYLNELDIFMSSSFLLIKLILSTSTIMNYYLRTFQKTEIQGVHRIIWIHILGRWPRASGTFGVHLRPIFRFLFRPPSESVVEAGELPQSGVSLRPLRTSVHRFTVRFRPWDGRIPRRSSVPRPPPFQLFSSRDPGPEWGLLTCLEPFYFIAISSRYKNRIIKMMSTCDITDQDMNR